MKKQDKNEGLKEQMKEKKNKEERKKTILWL